MTEPLNPTEALRWGLLQWQLEVTDPTAVEDKAARALTRMLDATDRITALLKEKEGQGNGDS